MVNIKMCGMTNLEDCQTAIGLGVEFVGFVFYKKSARYVAPETVRKIVDKIGGNVKTVGVFVEETKEEIDRLIDYCQLDLAQVYCNITGDGVIRAYRVDDCLPEVSANGLVLFDSYSEGFGGSGTPFDVSLLKGHSSLGRAFIAGGIDEGNVYRALDLKPFGIDLVSAVESEKGKKDLLQMERFVEKVRSYQI
jgi:phosphoribosylanthranilate isomerase